MNDDIKDFLAIASNAVSYSRFSYTQTPEKALLAVTQMRAALDRIEARNVAANKEEATR